MPSQRTITISQGHNFSYAFWDTVTSIDRLNIVIEDIKADKDINIEIKQFFSLYSVYAEFENKRREIEKKLAITDDDAGRKLLIEEREKYVQEEKQIRINILFMAHIFNRMKYSPLIQEVADLFFLGDTQRAFNKLNPDELVSDQDHILALIENGIALENTRDRLEDNANEFKVKANLSTLNFDIENPEDRFQKSLGHLENGKKSAFFTRRDFFYANYLFEYAAFLQAHNLPKKAQVLYEDAIPLERQLAETSPEIHLPRLSSNLNNLGILCKNENMPNLALMNITESLGIRRKLADENPQIYLIDLADSLSSLAELNRTQKKFDQCLPQYIECLKIRRYLADKYPIKTHLIYLVGILNNLGEYYRELNNPIMLKKFYNEALSILRDMQRKGFDDYETLLAKVLRNLGNANYQQADIKQAVIFYEESLNIYSKLMEKNPRVYLIDLARIKSDFALSLVEVGNFIQAKCFYQEAIQIFRELLVNTLKGILPDLAATLCNFGVWHHRMNESSKSIPFFEESLEIYKQLSKTNQRLYMPDVLHILNNMCIAYKQTGEKNQFAIRESQYFEYQSLLKPIN